MVSSWSHLISVLPKWKTHPSLVMTKHIRERSRKPSTPQTRDGTGTLASLPLILKHKTAVYFPLPHKWSIIVCSERPSGKNRITKGPVHRFVSQISLLDPTWYKSPPEVIEIRKTSTNQFSKILLYPDHLQVQNKFSIKDNNETEKLPQTKAWSSVRKYPLVLKDPPCANRPIGS